MTRLPRQTCTKEISILVKIISSSGTSGHIYNILNIIFSPGIWTTAWGSPCGVWCWPNRMKMKVTWGEDIIVSLLLLLLLLFHKVKIKVKWEEENIAIVWCRWWSHQKWDLGEGWSCFTNSLARRAVQLFNLPLWSGQIWLAELLTANWGQWGEWHPHPLPSFGRLQTNGLHRHKPLLVLPCPRHMSTTIYSMYYILVYKS